MAQIFVAKKPSTFKTDVSIDSDGCVAQAGITVAGVKSLSFPMVDSTAKDRWSDTKNFAASIITSIGGGTFDYYADKLSVDYVTDDD